MTRFSNDLADWYPALAATGVPTPATTVIRTDVDLAPLLRGVSPDGLPGLVEQITHAAGELGFPAFLRTGHTAAKQEFSKTAYVRRHTDVLPHLAALVEQSALATDTGLPVNTWVVREFLPIRPAFLAFRGLPVAAERRYYFNALGQITGHHPLWNPDTVAAGMPRGPRGFMPEREWRQVLEVLNAESEAEVAELTALTEQVAQAFAFQGAWSLDFLYTSERGWVAIDMSQFADADIWHEHPTAPYSARRVRPFTGMPSSNGPAGRIEADLLVAHGLV